MMEGLVSYIVEKMDIRKDIWEKVDEVPAVEVEQGGKFVYAEVGYTVNGLIKGNTYIFRVIAVNLDGEGPAGDPTVKVEIKQDDDDIGPIEVVSGRGRPSRRSMSFSVFSGAPFAKQALEREMAYRKEESLANLLNKSV